MEGFSFVTPLTGLNGPNAGKEDDDGDDELQEPTTGPYPEPTGSTLYLSSQSP
jgi:hypothetical protein